MRVTFLSALADSSGGSLVIAEHARRLRLLGHEVTIVTRWPAKLPWRTRIRELLRGNGWHTHEDSLSSFFDDLPLPVKRLPAGTVPSPADLPDADILIATWFETVAWALAMPRTKGTVVHFVQGYEAFGPFRKEDVERALRAPIPKITVSRYLTELLTSLAAKDVTTIPNSIDHERFGRPPRAKSPRPTVGFTYSHEEIKGGDVLGRVVASLRATLPDLRVIGFGLRPPISEHAGLLVAEFTVRPAQAVIPGLYASADVWLCASRLEGFGLPILESLASGTPVVTTNVGAALDLVQPGVTGFVVDVDDAEALARRAFEVLSWPGDRWASASATAAANARSWTWERASARFAEVLARIAAR